MGLRKATKNNLKTEKKTNSKEITKNIEREKKTKISDVYIYIYKYCKKCLRDYFVQKISMRARTAGSTSQGKQVAWMISEYFKVSDSDDSLLDLMIVTITNQKKTIGFKILTMTKMFSEF